jgi:integrase/transcription elongation factor Elf1
MAKINWKWKEDYRKEFVCPECNNSGMLFAEAVRQKNSDKARFRCPFCRRREYESCDINIQVMEDPTNFGVIWYTDNLIAGFICPKCQTQNIYLSYLKRNKKIFRCRECTATHPESHTLKQTTINRYAGVVTAVKTFNWLDNEWDLRGISPKFDQRDNGYFMVDFSDILPGSFQNTIKNYVRYLCKIESSFRTVKQHFSVIKNLSNYLAKVNCSSFNEINRSLIIDYFSKQEINRHKLGILRKFFTVGSLKNWFSVEQDIIRNADYPKYRQTTPDPLSDIVREQIEQNLHILPDPIARMWLICYFAAMRPSELALLKQDCLVQEGQNWKLVWRRKKGKDEHEVPISGTIAKIIQEQQEYIQNLWGEEWDCLFCHYHNLSITDPSQPKLEPIKKVISSKRSPLSVCINALIRSINICDENGQPAKFQPQLLRHTRLTNLFEEGHDLFVVSAWAGHKQLHTTSTYYTKVSCDLMEKEAGHIHQALVTSNGHRVLYESFPKSFWKNPTAHKLELGATHINTPIYGYCGLPLEQDCHKSRACYTCQSFVATLEKLPQYINTRDELRTKQAKAMSAGQEVLVEQFGTQADQLDKIIASLQQEAA